MKQAAILILLFAFSAGVAVGIFATYKTDLNQVTVEHNTNLPCLEDEIIVGTGNFSGPEEGWESYTCKTGDDYVVEVICRNPERWYIEPTACKEF